MRYYCKNCEAEYNPGHSTKHIDYELKPCLFCGGLQNNRDTVEVVLDYETPEQYENRTGKSYHYDSPIWYRYSNDKINWSEWNLSTLKLIEFTKKNLLMIHIQRVCANSRNGYPPPDYWRL